MASLAEIQNNFQAYIHQNSSAANKPSGEVSTAINKSIVNDTLVGAEKRLSIYFNAYRYRLIETLATQYPKLYLYLGDNQFQQHALAYIELTPSTCRNLRNYGDNFDQFLAQTLPTQPQIAELARFEWLLGLAFDAVNQQIITVEDLAQIPPESWGSLKFSFHHSVSSFETQWNTIEIWQALKHEQSPPQATQLATPIHWVIWRSELDANYRSLSQQEHQAFKLAYKDAADFATICEQLAEVLAESPDDDVDVAMIAAQYLVQWLNDEYIVAIHQS